jgi:uncharacterized protein (TIGR03437 family)
LFSLFRFPTLALIYTFSAWASSYTLYSISNKPTAAADHVRAFDVAVGGVLADRAGNIYLTGRGPINPFNSSAPIFKVGADGILLPFAGQGSGFLSPGDSTPAVLAGSLYATPSAVDTSGNVYLAGGPNGFVRTSIYRVTPDGMISIYVVTPASWTSIFGMTADAAGNLYVLAGSGASASIVKIAPDLSMTTISQMRATAIASDDTGNLYIANRPTNQIVKLDTAGNVTALAQLDSIASLALDRGGNLYVSQDNLAMVRRVAPDGGITIIAGNGAAAYGGDGGPAASASLALPTSLTVDPSGNLYIADGARVRVVDASGTIRTFAGCACGGDGVPATWVRTGFPLGVAMDTQGSVYYSDQSTHMVRKIAADGSATVVAGIGESGFTGDLGPARQSRLASPAGLAFDSAGNLYIADEQNNRIRRVSPGGIIQTVAGNGAMGWSGDGGPATAASLGQPDGVAVDAGGNIYIADTVTHRIRKITTDGIIHTIAGSDQYGLTGDGGPAAQALLINPRGLAFDHAGDLLITDSSAHVVREITPAGIIQRVAGTGQTTGANGIATQSAVPEPWGIAVDAAGNILIGAVGEGAVLMVSSTGVLSTLFTGTAYSLAVDPAGRIWFAGGGATPAGGGSINVASQTGPPFPLSPVIFDGGFTSAAMIQSSEVAPGEIVSIYGARLGPAAAVPGIISGGVLQMELAGVRVLFDGIPSPLLYASAGQINAVAPWEISGKSTVTLTVEYQGVASNPVMLDVAPAVPSLFEATLAGVQPVLAAVKQDGSLSGPGNPAVAGSIVSIYGAGAGLMNAPAQDGQITGATLTHPQLQVSVSAFTGTQGGSVPARILSVTYAGDAPDFVSGALQVNVQLPDDLLTGYYYLQLRVGNAISGAAALFTRAKQ